MNSLRHIFILAFAVVTISLASAASAAEKVHYRWLDNRGNPVHSDRPPPKGVDYEVIETGSSLIRKVSGEQGAVPPETTPRVGNEFTPVDTKPDEVCPYPEYCQRARENLSALESGAEISMRNEQGEPRTLTADEVAAQISKAREAIRRYCR